MYKTEEKDYRLVTIMKRETSQGEGWLFINRFFRDNTIFVGEVFIGEVSLANETAARCGQYKDKASLNAVYNRIIINAKKVGYITYWNGNVTSNAMLYPPRFNYLLFDN